MRGKRFFAVLLLAALVMASAFSQSAAANNKKARILMLATGGTIAGVASGISPISYKAGTLSGRDIVESVPGIEKLADIDVEQVANIASQDMDYATLKKLSDRINSAFDNDKYDGVVITHGTDTMEETAFFLDFTVANEKPVVLTGSMRPATEISPDGPKNLYDAMIVASDPSAYGRGVVIAMNGYVWDARHAMKFNTNSVETFSSTFGGPIGAVDATGVMFFSPRPGNKVYFPLKEGKLPRVDIIYAHTAMEADVVDDCLAHGAEGIVLAGVGDGNACAEVINRLRDAALSGVAVIRSSRVPTGKVNRNAEIDDDKMRFAASLDLSPHKARLLLQLMLASGIKDPEEIQKFILEGLVCR